MKPGIAGYALACIAVAALVVLVFWGIRRRDSIPVDLAVQDEALDGAVDELAEATDPLGAEAAIAERKPLQVVAVATVGEFVAALGDNTHIRLAPGVYDFSELEETSHPHIRWKSDFGRTGPLFSNLKNVVVDGGSLWEVVFHGKPPAHAILQFQDCEDITVRHILMGYEKEDGEYESEWDSGYIFYGERCRNLQIHHSELFGAPATAIRLDDVAGFTGDQVSVRDSNLGVSVISSTDVSFTRSIFHHNRIGGSFVFAASSLNTTFEDCDFLFHQPAHWPYGDYEGDDNDDALKTFFSACGPTRISVSGSRFCFNRHMRVCSGEGSVSLTNNHGGHRIAERPADLLEASFPDAAVIATLEGAAPILLVADSDEWNYVQCVNSGAIGWVQDASVEGAPLYHERGASPTLNEEGFEFSAIVETYEMDEAPAVFIDGFYDPGLPVLLLQEGQHAVHHAVTEDKRSVYCTFSNAELSLTALSLSVAPQDEDRYFLGILGGPPEYIPVTPGRVTGPEAKTIALNARLQSRDGMAWVQESSLLDAMRTAEAEVHEIPVEEGAVHLIAYLMVDSDYACTFYLLACGDNVYTLYFLDHLPNVFRLGDQTYIATSSGITIPSSWRTELVMQIESDRGVVIYSN